MRKSSDPPDACGERSRLWAYAAGELAPAPRAQLAQHLESCAGCRAELEAITATRDVLALASSLDSREADGEPGTLDAAEGRGGRRGRLPLLIITLGAVAGLLVLWAQVRASRPARPPASAVTSAGTPRSAPPPHGEVAFAGEALAAGRAGAGAALTRFPDGSLALLDAGAELRFERATPTDLAISLVAGRVGLRASAAPRTGFVVSAGAARARVIGGSSETLFGLAIGEGALDLSVARGEVLLETGDGAARLVVGGERVAADLTGWSVRALALGSDESARLEALGREPADAAAPPETRAGQTSAGGPRPVPGGGAPSAPAAASRTTLAGPGAPTPTPASPDRTRGGEAARSSTPAIWLDQAEEALRGPDCLRSMDVLEAHLGRAELLLPQREKTRILRARCFARERRSVDADAEYRSYLREHPQGSFADEARRAVAH